jgi:hypothetical protein
MITGKRGYWYRAIFAIIGSIMLLIALFYLNQEKVVNTAVFGIVGVLLITISIFPFVKSNISV